MRLLRDSIKLGFIVILLAGCKAKEAPSSTPPTGDAAAQAQQVVQEAATGVVQRYEYVPDKNLVKAYWEPAELLGNQELIGKHTNTAIVFASRVFKRDSNIRTIDFITTIPKDSNSSERIKALEDVIDRDKFLAIDWVNLTRKPAIAPFLRSTTSHWVEPTIQSDIETKPIDQDILYTPFDTGTGQ